MGIIIDTFAELKSAQATIDDNQKSCCFICSLDKSALERKSVKFNQHILEDHYMWAYARFLLYLEETDNNMLTGPESYVKAMIMKKNFTFFPIGKCIALEASEAGESHLEREVRVKDIEELKLNLKHIGTHAGQIKETERSFKGELKEIRENVQVMATKVQLLTAS